MMIKKGISKSIKKTVVYDKLKKRKNSKPIWFTVSQTIYIQLDEPENLANPII